MADANARNALARALMEAPPYNALAQFNQPQPNALARGTLKPGPEPTGYDRLFDGIYGALGGTPDRRALAEALSGAVNVGTLGMATGAYDGAKELAQTGQPGTLAMALMPGAKVAAPAVNAATQAAKKAIRGFHASPYEFDKVDLSKMGSGNGYAAFGQGFNISSTEKGARPYGKHMYEVQVNAPEETFLNWDDPVLEQPKQIQDAVAQLLKGQPLDDVTGQGAAVMSGPFEKVRERLQNVGINGITHGMRGGQGYVVFDDSLIEILRKYGLLPPAVVGGVAASQSDAQAGQ